MSVTVTEKSPLEWPAGWERCRIQDRKARGGWKKSFRQYRDAVSKELDRMGASEMLVSFNPAPSDRMDCGVAVYFSKIAVENYEWQEALGLLTPAPTVAQIDAAFREKAMPHHPDRHGDIEIFKSLVRHREQARAWVLGKIGHEHEYVIACDRFTESRLNLAAIRLALAALRQLERVGASGVMERAFRGFKTALPAQGETYAPAAS